MEEKGDINYYKKKKKAKSDLMVVMKKEIGVDIDKDIMESEKVEFSVGNRRIELEIEDAVFLGLVLIKWGLKSWEDFINLRKMAISMCAREDKKEDLRYVG